MPRFCFTHHAIEQFVTRYERSLSRDEGLRQLKHHAADAEKMREKTPKGQDKWLLSELGVILISTREEDRHIVLTVIPVRSTGDSEWEEESVIVPEPKPAPQPEPEPKPKAKTVNEAKDRKALRDSLRVLASIAYDRGDASGDVRRFAVSALVKILKTDSYFLSYAFLTENGSYNLSRPAQEGLAKLLSGNLHGTIDVP